MPACLPPSAACTLRGLYYTAIRNREKSLSLGWALERAARLYPDNPAVLDGQRRISYALFNGWANRLARAFKAEGVATAAWSR